MSEDGRRRDAFSRFYWIPVIFVGFVAYAMGLNIWITGALGLAVMLVLIAFDWLYVRRGTKRERVRDRRA